jgi:hypothetical protein
VLGSSYVGGDGFAVCGAFMAGLERSTLRP